jgi:hypothetical protein
LSCLKCCDGKEPNQHKTSCDACGLGHVSDGRSCHPCKHNTWTGPGSANCSECQLGWQANTPASKPPSNRTGCEDVDECSILDCVAPEDEVYDRDTQMCNGNDDCYCRYTGCVNTQGSFHCRPGFYTMPIAHLQVPISEMSKFQRRDYNTQPRCSLTVPDIDPTVEIQAKPGDSCLLWKCLLCKHPH